FVAGSWGTLAAMTEITIKVLPRNETVETVLVLGLDDVRAVEAMSAAMGSTCEVSGAAHLPQDAAAGVAAAASAGKSVTALRLEGVPASVAYRKAQLEQLLAPSGELASFGAKDSAPFWRAVRDAHPFADGSQMPVWRISTVPSEAPKIAAAIRASAGAKVFYDWAGGLIWAMMPTKIAEEWAVRAALSGRGHGLLLRAEPAVRASAHVF